MENIPSHLKPPSKKKPELTISGLICFSAVVLLAFNAARNFGHWVVLRMAFGSLRVSQEHLYVVDDKGKAMVFSNGRVLPDGLVAADRAIMLLAWFALVPLLWLLVYPLIPKDRLSWPHLRGIPLRLAGGAIVTIVMCEFFLITFAPLGPALALSVGAIAVSTALARIVRANLGGPHASA